MKDYQARAIYRILVLIASVLIYTADLHDLYRTDYLERLKDIQEAFNAKVEEGQ